MSRTIGKLLGTAAVAAALAVLPSAASAAQGPISGASYRGCTTVTGTYGWELTNAGMDLYRTWGSARLVNHPSKCPTGFTTGILQRSTTHTTDDSWKTYAVVHRGETFTRDLGDTDVRGVRFRICNLHSGKLDGCGRVQ